MGPAVTALLDDPTVTELSANSDGHVWIDRVGHGRRDTGELLTPAAVQRILAIVADAQGETIGEGNPSFDAIVPGHGYRFVGTLPPLTPAPTMTIRKKPSRVITLPEEYTPLLARINFEGVATIFDPCNGSGSTTRQLAQLFSSSPSPPSSAPTIISSDIDPSVGAQHCGNALDPSFLSRVQDEYGGLDVIITSPWFRMLDLFIPILFRFAQQALFIHVPGHCLTNMPTARRHWFRRHAGFIKIITADMPVGLIGRRCAWLCIFKTAAVKRRMLSLLPGDTTLNTII